MFQVWQELLQKVSFAGVAPLSSLTSQLTLFSASDILGRHEAVHVAREGRNEHPHRKRACFKCAKVRERCSRGEPCRRCKTKGLCCLYPEESRFKISMPDTWTPATPGSDGCDATTVVEDTQTPLEPLHARRDLASQEYMTPRYEAEDTPDLYRRSLLPAIFSNWDSYHCPPEYEDVSFLSSVDCDVLPSGKHGGGSRRPHKKSKYNDAEPFVSEGTASWRLSQYYGGTGAQTAPQQAIHYSDEATLRELDPYLLSQDQCGPGGLQQLLLENNNNSRRRQSHANANANAEMSIYHEPFRPSTAPTTSTTKSAPHSSSSPTTSSSSSSSAPDAPPPRLVNIRDYEVIATRFKEFRNQSRFATSFGSSTASSAASSTDTTTTTRTNIVKAENSTPRTEQHDALLRLYFEYFSSHPGSGDGGPRQCVTDAQVGFPERFGGCLDDIFV
ncbi:hypothetical protein F5Y17DRAFT_230604 [Xylariaceae sp. FL0594]|nr:hypothetical protein F5Y17DRAFT_230604 [Xylariaceae sp. FL0594]